MKGGSRYGAGRPARHAKVEHCRSIDIGRFSKANMLRPGSWGWAWTDRETGKQLASIGVSCTPSGLVLDYTYDGRPISERIMVRRTPCHYGGSRPWFHCPRCDARVAKLYLRGGRFKCRQCHGLRYTSQSEDELDRCWRKQSKLEAKLGPNWSRPKGMHHATRDKLLEGIWACEAQRDDALVAYMDRVGFNRW